MAPVAQDVKDRATEFASTPDATINLALADAELQVNAANWGDRADIAKIYLAAHLLKIWELQSGSAPGPTNSMTDGSLSVSFAIATGLDSSDLSSTVWGRQYERMRRDIFSSRVL